MKMAFETHCLNRSPLTAIVSYVSISKENVCVAVIDKYTGKLDHSPLVVVEAELGQVWPFCCWYSTTMLIHRK